MTDDPITLDDVADLIQRWITQQEDEPVVVTGAMLTWEQVRYDDDGQQWRQIRYADLLATGLASAIGLLVAGKRQVMDDLFGEPDDTEETD